MEEGEERGEGGGGRRVALLVRPFLGHFVVVVVVDSAVSANRDGDGDGDSDWAPQRTETMRGSGRLYSQILRRSSGGSLEKRCWGKADRRKVSTLCLVCVSDHWLRYVQIPGKMGKRPLSLHARRLLHAAWCMRE